MNKSWINYDETIANELCNELHNIPELNAILTDNNLALGVESEYTGYGTWLSPCITITENLTVDIKVLNPILQWFFNLDGCHKVVFRNETDKNSSTKEDLSLFFQYLYFNGCGCGWSPQNGSLYSINCYRYDIIDSKISDSFISKIKERESWRDTLCNTGCNVAILSDTLLSWSWYNYIPFDESDVFNGHISMSIDIISGEIWVEQFGGFRNLVSIDKTDTRPKLKFQELSEVTQLRVKSKVNEMIIEMEQSIKKRW